MSYSFSFTAAQLDDFFRKYARRNSKMSLIFAIICTVVSAALFLCDIFIEQFDTMSAALFFVIFAAVFWALFYIVRSSASKQSPLYFKENSVDGLITYVVEFNEKDFVVSVPAKGNVTHYSYDIISRVIDLDGFAAVILATNLCLPLLSNDETSQLVATFKSYAKTK